MNKYIKTSIFLTLLSLTCVAFGQNNDVKLESRISAKISKTGLNRISNHPYQILQVTGDESLFKLKYDQDGANVYIMPLKEVGSKIELSVKNSAGFVYDLELLVASVKGQSICIESSIKKAQGNKSQRQDIAEMLNAMEAGIQDKFYVQNIQTKPTLLEDLSFVQTKVYKWKNLSGGVFVVANNTSVIKEIPLSLLTSRFDKVLTSFACKTYLLPRKSERVFIIQKTN